MIELANSSNESTVIASKAPVEVIELANSSNESTVIASKAPVDVDNNDDNTKTSSDTNTIVESSCKLSCDLIYYEDEVGIPSPMVRIQEELEKGVSLVMTDYVNVISTLPAQPVPLNQTPKIIQ